MQISESITKHLLPGSYILLSVLLLGYTGRDDSHIIYYVADQLADGRGIVNYSGDNIEQSSSLLFTFLLALASLILDQSSALIGLFLSIFLLLTCLVATTLLLRAGQFPPMAAALSCTAAPVLYWSFSGMENSLYLLLLSILSLVLWASIQKGRWIEIFLVGMFAFAIVLTRPEGLFVLATLGTFLFFTVRLIEKRNLLAVPIAIALGTVLAIIFRLSIGLEVFPNPVYVKQSLDIQTRIFGGISYFARSFTEMPGTSILSFVSFLSSLYLVIYGNVQLNSRMLGAICICITATVGLFAFLSGGDWMENGRFLVPAFYFSILGFAVLSPDRFKIYLILVFCTVSLGEIIYYSKQPYGGLPIWAPYRLTTEYFRPDFPDRYNGIHARDLKFADQFLKVLAQDPRDSIVIASHQAGAVAYYVFSNSEKDLTFIDLAGLASKHVLRCERHDPNTITDPQALVDCIGVRPDYVFDPEYQNWQTLQMWIDFGCPAVIRDELEIIARPWKSPVRSQQYLVRCSESVGN